MLVTTEDGSQGETGPVTGPLERLLLDPASRPDGGVYAVGPVRMLEEIDRVCGAHKVPRQLSWEVVMRRGRCAMGLCGECELQLPDSLDDPDRAAWLVCLDGPVSHTEQRRGQRPRLPLEGVSPPPARHGGDAHPSPTCPHGYK